ncbi:hypothetical protein [Planococcus donghaensis]|uniref:hypothetical protein n=1 Tax=Planococcus donghaensis TaxID=414778 RepID=UPI0037358BE3
MHYQLNLHLSRDQKNYDWLFESEEDTITVFDEVLDTFQEYEPPNTESFQEEKQREIDSTGKSDSVQIKVIKVDKEALIRSAAYDGMWYEDQHFQDIYKTLTDRLVAPQEEPIA